MVFSDENQHEFWFSHFLHVAAVFTVSRALAGVGIPVFSPIVVLQRRPPNTRDSYFEILLLNYTFVSASLSPRAFYFTFLPLLWCCHVHVAQQLNCLTVFHDIKQSSRR